MKVKVSIISAVFFSSLALFGCDNNSKDTKTTSSSTAQAQQPT